MQIPSETPATTAPGDSPGPRATPARSRRPAAAAAAGTIVEYYEFGIYGYLAVVIGPLFFPGGDPMVALLAALAVFGTAFPRSLLTQRHFGIGPRERTTQGPRRR
jgi:MHS family proline/betaine transporter-like MFS transporter